MFVNLGEMAKIAEGDKFPVTRSLIRHDSEAVANILDDQVKAGDIVVVRYEGPKGGPGMQEMLYPTSYIKSKGLGKACALLTDGRFSGGSHGFIIGHITPEAHVGGNIALVQDGDIITIDAKNRTMNVELSDAELLNRRNNWTAPAYRVTSGTLYKFIKNVQSASLGCVTDE